METGDSPVGAGGVVDVRGTSVVGTKFGADVSSVGWSQGCSPTPESSRPETKTSPTLPSTSPDTPTRKGKVLRFRGPVRRERVG